MPCAYQIMRVVPASPKRLFEAWLDSREHSDMTGRKAAVGPCVGDSVSLLDGLITGVERARRAKPSLGSAVGDRGAGAGRHGVAGRDGAGRRLAFRRDGQPVRGYDVGPAPLGPSGGTEDVRRRLVGRELLRAHGRILRAGRQQVDPAVTLTALTAPGDGLTWDSRSRRRCVTPQARQRRGAMRCHLTWTLDFWIPAQGRNDGRAKVSDGGNPRGVSL